MLVSPSDIREERQICINTIVEWNSINAEALNTIFNVIGWDINAYPATGMHPQEILNKQLLEKADILIGIFWTRIGTSTKEYSSGSTEEIMKHIESGKPALIYFSSVPIMPGSVDINQFEKLMGFKNLIKNQSFYKEYSNINEFQKMLFKDIQSLVNSGVKLRKESINNSTIPLNPLEEIIKTLNESARYLLQEIAQGGSGTIMISKTLGTLNFQTDFNGYDIDYNDGRRIAEFNDAIDQMENLNLIRDTDYKHEVFQITSLGYKIADLLQEGVTVPNKTVE
jgi:hypothetical protein